MATPLADRQISWPFRFGTTGGVADTTSLAKQVQDHVVSAVGTQQGERVMAAVYGTDVIPFLFCSLDEMMEQDIQQTISDSILQNAPEVVLDGIDVERDQNGSALSLQVNYHLSAAPGATLSVAIPLAFLTEGTF